MSIHKLLPLVLFIVTANAVNKHTTTPPMGWNSYNHYSCYANETQIQSNAQALVDLGLASVGYTYVVPDCGWSAKTRTSEGKITWNETFYPSGFPALGKKLHSLGLMFGIYSGAGTWQCHPEGANYLIQASLGHEKEDAQTFSDWGGDYLKYDNCWADGKNFVVYYPNETDPSARFRKMATEIDAVPRDFVYGICQWGVGNNLERWASKIGNDWRMSNDITNAWHSIFRITNQVVPLARYSKPGGYNDMDMLMVGNGVLTPEESRTHFSIWAMEKSPLFIGAALENNLLDADALKIFSNKEVVAINQDPLGRSAELVRRFSEEEYDVWAGPLAGDGMVVAVINWGAAERNITINLPDVGIQSAKKARDVWAATDLDGLDTTYSALIPSHGVKLLRLEGLTKAGEYTGKIGSDGTAFKNVYAFTSSSNYTITITPATASRVSLIIDGKNPITRPVSRSGIITDVSLSAGLHELRVSSRTKSLRLALSDFSKEYQDAPASLSFNVDSTISGSKVVDVSYINYDLSFDKAWSGEGLNVLNATFSVNGGKGKTWRFPISGQSWEEVGTMRIELDGFRNGRNVVNITGVEGKMIVKGVEIWG